MFSDDQVDNSLSTSSSAARKVELDPPSDFFIKLLLVRDIAMKVNGTMATVKAAAAP